ncbi:hypothetical protein SAMN05216456_1931 [Devosia crocina]|uniref:Uncharacterized protein n=1 Tax=Devosia crocina TaxID=429728 RepID=A0A1I7NF01_9HYPH|nr:hypothetical protein [Devosia crocina]SFV33244.1 hypothetical protein SAMN05216456_1931 [Devosia crocina]
MTRFPNYEPSTALREAIAAYRQARAARAVGLGQSDPAKRDRAVIAGEDAISMPGQLGGPDALTETPGREGTETGAASKGSCHDRGGRPDFSGSDALASGRDDDA